MALFDAVPTVARFRLMSPKPAAFEAIPDDTIALFLDQASGELQSALGDRGELPVLQWDASCDGAARALAARGLMGMRGYNRQAGADEEIVKLAERADDFLDRCRPGAGGANGKRENPRVVFTSGDVIDAPRVTSHARSDWWTNPRRCCR